MKNLFLTGLLVFFSTIAFSQRQVIDFNQEWKFRKVHSKMKETLISTPHCWNIDDALDPSGKPDYFRGLCSYKKTLTLKPEWEGKRIFIRFLGVNNVANIYVNGKHIGEHKGGYTAFAFDMTPYLYAKKKNRIEVKVSNAWRADITPLGGDFNIYGGIYRPVELLVLEPSHITPMDYGSSGVYITQRSVSEQAADLVIDAKVTNGNSFRERLYAHYTIKDQDGKTVYTGKSNKMINGRETITISRRVRLENPHLWDGKRDPYLYTVETVLKNEAGKVFDRVEQTTGFRYFEFHPKKGFLLNGKHMKLRGVNRHQDRLGKGYALSPSDHEQDMALMKEMGVNSIRLAHYPQSPYMYSLADKEGMVVWAEIPMLEYHDNEGFKENCRQQLIELIRQQYNHPSIVTWSLFNEIKDKGTDDYPFVSELNRIAHGEDPSRPTTSATHIGGDFIKITDINAWNKYIGWYGKASPAKIDGWLKRNHENDPGYGFGISEYGAGASLKHYEDTLKQPTPKAVWHPEKWQTHYHEEHWRAISKFDPVWGTYVWNMFDFGAAHRVEGDTFGRNDKGLVTIDRKERKDSFYFYKANWNRNEPFIHIAEQRFAERKKAMQYIKAFTNLDKTVLTVNGKKFRTKRTDNGTCLWEGITLKDGENTIKVSGKKNGKIITDECVLILKKELASAK
ncbi:beta-galactosidase [Fulvitalea axinellae]|uniref:Beta-galactosidase n=1 Tax=Fulvitalea axinellae TaxID=1182444 RepID=A0AAU9CLU5_9BACT|nr:beta-galactosidase [Fulvitalea axinellae]